jgi:hypothetical protein
MKSQDYSALTFCIMAFTRLIYPLEYVFPVIPLLPSCMASSEQVFLLQYLKNENYSIRYPEKILSNDQLNVIPFLQLLLAPTPFIIGISSEFTTQKNLKRLPSDIWEIEIDSAIINPPPGTTVAELPSFPEPEGKILRYHLKQVIFRTRESND